jgi:hypothetical protein
LLNRRLFGPLSRSGYFGEDSVKNVNGQITGSLVPEHKTMKQNGGNGCENKISDCLGVAFLIHPDLAPWLKTEYGCTSTLSLNLHGLY